MLGCALVAAGSGCGKGADDGYGAWIKPPPGLAEHIFPVRSEEEAARIVQHELEDHCGREFVETRCKEAAKAWLCQNGADCLN